MQLDIARRWRGRGRRARVLILAGSVLALVALGDLLTHSAVFSARTITVHGESHLTEAAVLKLAGIGMGTNVFYLDTRAAAARIAADPWVASAAVARSLPSTVTISVVEVRPVGVTVGAHGRELVAQDGSLLGPAPGAVRLPVIATSGEGSAGPAASALAAFPAAFLPKVARVDVAVDGTLTLTLRDGVLVTYGSASDVERKAQALRAVLAWAQRQPIGVISVDVSAPTVPTAHLRGATSATAVPLRSPSPSTPSTRPSPSPSR